VLDIPDPLPWDFIVSHSSEGVKYLEMYGERSNFTNLVFIYYTSLEYPAPPIYICCRLLSLLVLRGGVIAFLVLGATVATEHPWAAVLFGVIGGFVQDLFQAVFEARIRPGRPFNFAPTFLRKVLSNTAIH
jgi:hypothetical protein